MSGGPSDLYDCAVALLGAADDALAVTVGGRIERVYVSPGPPAFDCEQLTVHVGGAQAAQTAPTSPLLSPLHRTVDSGIVPIIALTLTVLRCVPVADEDGADAPAADDLSRHAVMVTADLWGIVNFLNSRKRDGSLFSPKEREFSVEPAVPVSPSGGLAGWQIPVLVALPGYRS